MTQSRSAYIRLTYEGKDITRDISPFLLTFTFTDNASGTADDISLTLEDRKSIWLTDWMPSKGDKLKASIVVEDSQTYTLPCGEYDIDQIEYSYPPRVISIKGVSASIKKAMKGEKHSRAWENVTLSTICTDIAASSGLALHYDGGYVMLERREQVQQSDLEFLEGLCAEHGLNVKISDGKLIVYSEADYDSHDSVTEIDASFEGLISVKFTSKSAGTYRKAKVKYHHPVKAEYYEAECEDDDEEGSERELEIYERVDSQSQAQEVAEKALTQANSKEITASITVKGDTRFLAGLNVTLTGFGMFNGKYFIEKATHTLGSGYTTALSLKMGGGAKKAIRSAKTKARSKVKASSSSGGGELFYEGDRHY